MTTSSRRRARRRVPKPAGPPRDITVEFQAPLVPSPAEPAPGDTAPAGAADTPEPPPPAAAPAVETGTSRPPALDATVEFDRIRPLDPARTVEFDRIRPLDPARTVEFDRIRPLDPVMTVEFDRIRPLDPVMTVEFDEIRPLDSARTVEFDRVGRFDPDMTVEFAVLARPGPEAAPDATARPARTPARPHGLPPWWRQWRWPRWRPSAQTRLVAGLTLAVLLVHAWNMTGFPAASDDEGTYLAQAWAVRGGLGLGHYTYWYDHPPLAWIQLAGLSWLPELLAPDGLAVPTGRASMLLVTAAIVVLTHLLARRLGLPRWAAAATVVVYGLSPLVVTTQRQIYLDSFAVAWLLAALVLALSPRRHLWHHVAAGAAAAAAVLCKETMLVALPAVVVALWQGTARDGVRAFSFAGFGSGLLLIGGFYPLYALLNGELLPGDGHVSLLGAWQFQLQSRTGSGSVFTSGSAAHAVVGSWLYYDAVLLVAGTLAAVAGLFLRRLRVPATAVATLALVALRPGGYLPTMYVIQALPFLALCLVGAVATVTGHALTGPGGGPAPRWRRTVLAAVAALAVGVVGLRWAPGAARAFTAQDNDLYAAAATWIREEVPDRRRTRVVVDDVLWLDLVRLGFPRENVLWFYKVDLDATVAAGLPGGWRDIDYVVSTPAMRGDRMPLPTVDALLANANVVAAFGSGPDRIEIRRVRPPAAARP